MYIHRNTQEKLKPQPQPQETMSIVARPAGPSHAGGAKYILARYQSTTKNEKERDAAASRYM